MEIYNLQIEKIKLNDNEGKLFNISLHSYLCPYFYFLSDKKIFLAYLLTISIADKWSSDIYSIYIAAINIWSDVANLFTYYASSCWLTNWKRSDKWHTILSTWSSSSDWKAQVVIITLTRNTSKLNRLIPDLQISYKFLKFLISFTNYK